MSFDPDATGLSVRLQTVDNPLDAQSAITTTARCSVDPTQPGPVGAA